MLLNWLLMLLTIVVTQCILVRIRFRAQITLELLNIMSVDNCFVPFSCLFVFTFQEACRASLQVPRIDEYHCFLKAELSKLIHQEKLNRPELKGAKSAEWMVSKMEDLVLHYILRTVIATPRNAFITKCKQVLVHAQLVGDDGVVHHHH